MAASDLFNRVHTVEDGGVDWMAIRAEIQQEASSDISIEERVALINVQHALFDVIERQWTDNQDRLREFRDFRSADYRLLLLKEAMSRGKVSTERLLGITGREIAERRMSPDDKLRFLAQNSRTDPSGAEEILALTGIQKQKRGLIERFFGKRSGYPS